MPASKSFWHSIGGVLTGIAAVITAIAALVGIFYKAGAPPDEVVAVPKLIGLPLESAAKILLDRNLQPGDIAFKRTETAESRTILTQTPQALVLVSKGAGIDLVVAVKLEKLIVPSVIGLPLDTARTTLLNNHLQTGGISYRDTESATEGTVLRQQPSPGQPVDPNTVIALVVARVSSGPPHGVAEKTDFLKVISTSPASPSVLRLGDKLNIRVEYSLESSEGALIWARPVTGGVKSPNYRAHGSPVYKKGEGGLDGWFYFDRPTVVDEVQVEMVDNQTRELISKTLYSVDLRWE